MARVTPEAAGQEARSVPGWLRLALRVVGPGLLIASGAIHLDLYLTGYRTIPTIGWLFLLQVIAAFILALAAAGLRSRLAAAAAAGFCLATLGGYILSAWVGLFGFKEVRTTAGIVAGVIEVAAFIALAALTLTPDPGYGRVPVLARIPARAAAAATAGLAVVAVVLLGVSAAGANGAAAAPATATGGELKTATINGVRVLTNAKGFAVYTFAPDTPGMSKCYGSCAEAWPPVPGPATAGPGVTGTLGTIKRAGGQLQATYDGHPLYTWVADSSPGQAAGNDVNLNGGTWYEVPVSGG
jgi:predicted lipoprotein with Yx(FWY)xxD motif